MEDDSLARRSTCRRLPAELDEAIKVAAVRLTTETGRIVLPARVLAAAVRVGLPIVVAADVADVIARASGGGS